MFSIRTTAGTVVAFTDHILVENFMLVTSISYWCESDANDRCAKTKTRNLLFQHIDRAYKSNK